MDLPPVTEATMRRAYGIASDFFAPGLDIDDLAQEALVGAVLARSSFRPEASTSFSMFERLCMRRRVITAVEDALRPKRWGGTPDSELSDMVTGADDVPALVERRFELRDLIARMGVLTPNERRIVVGFAVGAKYSELGGSVKNTDNTYRRARSKLRAPRRSA